MQHSFLESLWWCSLELLNHTQGWCRHWYTWQMTWSGMWILRCASAGREARCRCHQSYNHPPGLGLEFKRLLSDHF